MPRPRVLLIDDSRTAQATLERGLEEAGFEVLVAGDAMEALDVLAQRRCAVVLADYQLPGTNGLDFLAALRGALPLGALDPRLGVDDPRVGRAGPGLRRGCTARRGWPIVRE
jgi:CheY-like chemotaxis protein